MWSWDVNPDCPMAELMLSLHYYDHYAHCFYHYLRGARYSYISHHFLHKLYLLRSSFCRCGDWGMAIEVTYLFHIGLSKFMTETSPKTGIRRTCRRSSHTLHQSKGPSKNSVIITSPPLNFLFPCKKRTSFFFVSWTCTWLTMATHTQLQHFLFPQINHFCWLNIWLIFCLWSPWWNFDLNPHPLNF